MTKAEIEARLRATGAFYIHDFDDLHELWATPWGQTFMIPMAGPYGALDDADVDEIVADIIASKP